MDKKDLLSKMKGLESNIQDQINNKADIDHTHEDLVGKPPLEHTHKKIDIIDFPTPFPINGGNVDTLDGKRASDFASTVHKHSIQNINSLESEFSNLRSTVTSGKNAIASAIKGRGGSADGNEDFATLARKITLLFNDVTKIYTDLKIYADGVRGLNQKFSFNLAGHIPEISSKDYLVLLFCGLSLKTDSRQSDESDRYLLAKDINYPNFAKVLTTSADYLSHFTSAKLFILSNTPTYTIYVSSDGNKLVTSELSCKEFYLDGDAIILPYSN